MKSLKNRLWKVYLDFMGWIAFSKGDRLSSGVLNRFTAKKHWERFAKRKGITKYTYAKSAGAVRHQEYE